jgi:glucosamine-6-phosphate deaminase
MQKFKELIVDSMKVSIYRTNELMGRAAAIEAAQFIKQRIIEKEEINIIFATANSQNTFLLALLDQDGIDWSKANIFHMDEYIGLPNCHPAAFRNVLSEQFLSRLIPPPKSFHSLPVEGSNLDRACKEMEALLKEYPCDLCVMGIGENGHIAFNEPLDASFNDQTWVKLVNLDNRSRLQQVNEGHFKSIDDVPTHAMTLTIPALLSAKYILCIVPEERKAKAVKDALVGQISENCPASILREHKHVHLYLDCDSASLIPAIVLDDQYANSDLGK